jgi:uncharacterized protein
MTTTTATVPTARNPSFDFAGVPRHWLGGDPVATHLVNGVNLLFPEGERFFIRSLRHYLDQLDEPLRERVRGFFAQEGRHAGAHERYNAILEAQGLRLSPFRERYTALGKTLERWMPPQLRLAVTVAHEHFTAIMAENALQGGVLDEAHPVMRALLLWHACEEIEHKSVAFDVLKRINPSYALRMAGLAVATITLSAFWAAAARMLLEQEELSRAEVRRRLQQLRARQPIGQRVFWRGIREYLRPDFHPWDHDNAHLAAAHLAKAGL